MGCIDKMDEGKAPMRMLGALSIPLRDVARVLEFGNRKYQSIHNFKGVPNGETRMLDAAMRHVLADLDGEPTDAESSLPHLAHAVCCLLMAMWHRIQAPNANK